MKNRWLRISLKVMAATLLLALVTLAVLYFILRSSLPQLDGEVIMPKLSKAVSLSRDARGTVTIEADNMRDAMRTLGFVHAQERFFEMDLARRSAAGELSALLGKATLSMDKEKRAHRFRHRMNIVWLQMGSQTGSQAAVTDQAAAADLTAYTEGVNAGLNSLSAKPWQYTLLQATPKVWTEVDSLLVMCEMYYMLQANSFEHAFENALLQEKLGATIFNWLKPLGGEFDAALDGSVIEPVAIPGADKINLRIPQPAAATAVFAQVSFTNTAQAETDNATNIGSNAWAISGALTAHGGAMLANDMHLGLGVPNIWFRTQLEITEKTDLAQATEAAETTAADKATRIKRRIVGVSLPGVPAMVAGSNGDIAWGFTNSYGKWFDWVPLAMDEAITVQREFIEVKGGSADGGENGGKDGGAALLEVRESRFGPIIKTIGKQSYALNWIAHRPGAINSNLTRLALAKTVDEALLIAQQSGVPHQNIFIVDKLGNSAWTIAGRMPARMQHQPGVSFRKDASLLADFTAADSIHSDWLAVDRYPIMRSPQMLRLWSGNNRQLGAEGGSAIGEGGFDLGARGQQIRDRLLEAKIFDEAGLYNIQLDTEARFMKRWVARVSAVADANRDNTNALAALRALKTGNGRADIDQAAYRIARAFRLRVLDELWKSWLKAALSPTSPPTTTASTTSSLPPKITWDGRFEYAAWQALSNETPHLLPLPFLTWNQFQAAQLNTVTRELLETNASLAEATWGKRNIARIRHPISRAVPVLGYFLDMPPTPLSGDNNMPKVAAPGFGASERMVVAPGHEASAILTMPGGQSGHPLSPFYGAGHKDWLAGKPSPLLAGERKYRLRFQLQASAEH